MTQDWLGEFDLYQKVKEALEADGSTIPFPQQDLHIIDTPTQAAS